MTRLIHVLPYVPHITLPACMRAMAVSSRGDICTMATRQVLTLRVHSTGHTTTMAVIVSVWTRMIIRLHGRE